MNKGSHVSMTVGMEDATTGSGSVKDGEKDGETSTLKSSKELKKIVPRGNTGEDVRTIVLPWKGGRGLDETMAAKSPTLELKAVETLELWLESST
jgi:hypothetical protein